jgi:hypothetical protein
MRTAYVVTASVLCLIAVGAVTVVLTTGAGAGSANPGAGTGSVRTSGSASASAGSAAGTGPGVAQIFAETSDWQLTYRLDCGSGSGATAVEFQVRALPGATLLTVNQPVASGTTAGTGRPGWQELSVSVTPSTCDWSLAAAQTQVTTTPSQP